MGWWASTVTREKRPRRAVVVRAIARSDHCRSRLNAQVSAGGVERDFQLPAQHEPGADLQRGRLAVGAQERLRGERALRMADEDPADGDRRQPGMRAHGGLRDDLDHPLRLAIPPRDGERRPRGGWIIAPVFPGRKPLADQARTPELPRRAWGRWGGGAVGRPDGHPGAVG